MTNICPACEKGILVSKVGEESFPYDGVRLTVQNFEYSACPVCYEEVVLPAQARTNEARFADAKRAHDGLLTASEIAGWRKRWDLTQQAAAVLLGGGANAFSKYERGEVIQSKAMDLLIRVSDKCEEARALLAERSGIAFGGGMWEPVSADFFQDLITTQRSTFAGGCGSTVVSIASHRMKLNRVVATSDEGQWHSEPELAHAL